MEGLGIAANGLAVVSIAIQLAESCIKLYRFWESIEDAPHEISAINEDLRYLILIFKRIESDKNPIGACIAEGIQHCRNRVLELTTIVEKLDAGFRSSSRRRRKWTAFKAAASSKHFQRFRESLGETKSTLTLALVHQCVVQSQSPTQAISVDMSVSESPQYSSNKVIGMIPYTPESVWTRDISTTKQKIIDPRAFREHCYIQNEPVSPDTHAMDVLMSFGKLLPQNSTTDSNIKHLMLHAIEQTAIASFESDSLEILAQDGYTVDANGSLQARTFVYSEKMRYHISHHATSFRTALGSIWIRKTIIYLPDKASRVQGRTQCVTAFIFYPMAWIQRLGIQNGLEAIITSAGRSWLFNCRLTVTRAVPEDALIFELCRTGQTRAVEILLSKGQGSVMDTSPKGWKPLHFAAAGGHVDLCAMLIEAGADKTALVYEGPSTTILSAISIFVACTDNLHADTKIAMLRLFSDCIDIRDVDSDGWTVHEWLKTTYAKERVPISQNSITWLLHSTANEAYVELSARALWCGLQYSVRALLCQERRNLFMGRILNLSQQQRTTISQDHLDATSLLMAFRVTGRTLLPMFLTAGSFLQIRGFDWLHDDITHRQYLQALPKLYSAWCHALLECVENLEHYIRLEWEKFLQELGCTRDEFLDSLSCQYTAATKAGRQSRTACTSCGISYSSLPGALVDPVRIAVMDCVQIGHKFDCVCCNIDLTDPTAISNELPEYTGVCVRSSNPEDSDANEEFYEATPYAFAYAHPSDKSHPEVFSDLAALLYRSHGRVWMGEYTSEERLCATCLLLRERYIDEHGSIAEPMPLPDHWDGLRFKW